MIPKRKKGKSTVALLRAARADLRDVSAGIEMLREENASLQKQLYGERNAFKNLRATNEANILDAYHTRKKLEDERNQLAKDLEEAKAATLSALKGQSEFLEKVKQIGEERDRLAKELAEVEKRAKKDLDEALKAADGWRIGRDLALADLRAVTSSSYGEWKRRAEEDEKMLIAAEEALTQAIVHHTFHNATLESCEKWGPQVLSARARIQDLVRQRGGPQ